MSYDLIIKYRKYLIALSVLFITIYIFSLFNRWAYGDDSWLGEYAWSYAHNGLVRAAFNSEMFSYGEIVSSYPRILIIIGALCINIFGWSLYSLKAVSLLFYLLFFFSLYCYLKKNNNVNSNNYFIVLFLLIISNPICFTYSFYFRPETQILFFGFLSYVLLHNGLRNNKKLLFVLSGILAVLALISSVGGVIFILAGAATILYFKKYSYFLLFIVGVFIGICFQVYDIYTYSNINDCLGQFMRNKAISNSSWIDQIINQHVRFFHSANEIFLTIIFILSLILSYKSMIIKNKELLVYTVILFIFFIIVTPPNKTYYFTTIIPFIYFPVVYYVFEVNNKQHKWSSYAFYTILIFSLAWSMVYALHMINTENYNIIAHNEKISSFLIEKNTTVITNREFIFNEKNNYNIRRIDDYLPLSIKDNFEVSINQLFQEGLLINAKYIIIDKKFLHPLMDIDISKLDFNILNTSYKVINKTNEIIIFEMNI